MAIPVFGQIHGVSFLVPAITGILRFRGLDRAMRVLAVLSFLACIDVGLQLLAGLWGIRNYFVSDYYRVVETSMLCAVLYFSVASRTARIILQILGIVFAAIWLVDIVWFHDPNRINSGMAMTSRIFLIVMTLITLQSVVRHESPRLIERSIFWVVMGVILYSSGTLLVLGLSNELLELGRPYFAAAWHINWFLLIIANLFYAKAMMCKYQA